MSKPIMARATAVWLVDNTTLTFKQIGDFVGMHELEIQGVADGDVDDAVRGLDPIVNHQLDKEEIERGEADPAHKLQLKSYAAAQGEKKRQGKRYTPLSKRQERPAAIYWLTKFHPELSDGQVGKLVGTTKPTITSIKDRSHWNMSNIQPVDPVALGFCKQSELDAAVQKAAKQRLKAGKLDGDSEDGTLVSTAQSLSDAPASEPRAGDAGALENAFLNAKLENPSPDDSHRLDAEAVFAKPEKSADDGA